jgi:hypothetical protein
VADLRAGEEQLAVFAESGASRPDSWLEVIGGFAAEAGKKLAERHGCLRASRRIGLRQDTAVVFAAPHP